MSCKASVLKCPHIKGGKKGSLTLCFACQVISFLQWKSLSPLCMQKGQCSMLAKMSKVH